MRLPIGIRTANTGAIYMLGGQRTSGVSPGVLSTTVTQWSANGVLFVLPKTLGHRYLISVSLEKFRCG